MSETNTGSQPTIAKQQVDSYTRRMQFLKVGLPLLAFGLIGALVLWPYLQPEEILPQNLSAQKTELTQNGLSMHEPRFSGTTKDQEPFLITARTAQQSQDDPALVELIAINATLNLRQLGDMRLDASGGDYHTVTRQLNLIGPIELNADNGVKMEMGDLYANLKSGEGGSDQPLMINAGAAQLKSGGLRVVENGNRIIFNRKVHITYYPDRPFPVLDRKNQTDTSNAQGAAQTTDAPIAIDAETADQNNE